MKLAGIELQNFRSIGNKPVILKPWRKCNVLIGQNNSGKSNAIRAVQKIFDRFERQTGVFAQQATLLSDLDLHRRSQEHDFRFRLYFEGLTSEDKELAGIAQIDLFYFDFTAPASASRATVIDHCFAHIEDFQRAQTLLDRLAGRRFTQHVGADTICKTFLEHADAVWHNFPKTIPPVHIIPEFRQIKPGDKYDFTGTDLIGLLSGYQHPEIGQDHNREKFDRIEHFIQRLLHLPEAHLEVTPDQTIVIKTITYDYLSSPMELVYMN